MDGLNLSLRRSKKFSRPPDDDEAAKGRGSLTPDLQHRLCNPRIETHQGRDTEAIEGDINRVSRDLLYIKNYPNSEKYVSILLPPTEENAARIERIRAGIERRLKDEAIVAEADEGAAIRVVQGGDGAAAEDDGIEAEDDFFLGEGEDGDLPVASTSAAPGGALPEVSGGESESDSGAGEEGAGAGGRGSGPRAGAGRLGTGPRTRPVIQDRKRGRVEGKPPRTPGGQQRGGSGGTAGKPKSKESTPARTRAEGGRKRRRKKN